MCSLNLISSYGSSSEDESLENSTIKKRSDNFVETLINPFNSNKEENVETLPIISSLSKKKKKEKSLKNPLRKSSVKKSKIEPTSSVFYNPFVKEQQVKNAILEKHVKLTTNIKDCKEINGKKICWSYRRGKCRFGHKCKFAHDSDLQISADDVKITTPKVELMSLTADFSNDTVECKEDDEKPRKRKPGLSEGLVPNKRSQDMFKSIQSKEVPWLYKNK